MPSGPTWAETARIPQDAFVIGVVGFAGGYVIALEDRNGAAVWFSADGVDWQAGALGHRIRDCSDRLTPDSFGSGASSDGQRAVVFGGLVVFTSENCANPDLGFSGGVAVWATSDGENWTRSNPFAERDAIIDDVWPIPGGGWEASVSSFDQPTAIWQSGDGLNWNKVASFAGHIGSSSRADIASDGTRLLDARLPSGQLALFRSSNGLTWTPLAGQPAFGDDEWVTEILAPGTAWLVVTSDRGGSGLWVSTDLASWQRHALPEDRVATHIIRVGTGYLASAERADRYFQACEADCPPPAERQYAGPSVLSWTEVTPRLKAGAFLATGPAGTIAVGRFDGRVWLLGP